MASLVTKVNPLQGTTSDREFSTGNTLPIIARPHGFNHWAMQTAPRGWFFHPAQRQLWGIRLTHQPSPWIGDYGSLLITPFHGPCTEQVQYLGSSYHLHECLPHSLKLHLLRYDLAVEMSPTERGARFVYTAASGNEPLKIRFHFDSRHEVNFTPGDKHFTGVTRDHQDGIAFGFGLYFYGEFDVDPDSFTPLPDGGYFTFPPEVRRIRLGFASSFISRGIAHLSFKREIDNEKIEQIRGKGEAIWNELLGRLAIEPRDEKQARTYYSCLYRCLLFPRLLEEIDEHGNAVHYSHYDGHIHPGPLCTDNGFWDTYRTVYPLLAMAYPDKLKTILAGWLNACQQAHWSPKWASPGLRDCMIGTHYDAVVADAVARGVTDWDVEKAFFYLWKNATVPSHHGTHGRQGLEDYVRLGYLPADHHRYSVASTLDYAYGDFCVSQVARYLGREKEADILRPRSLSYRNVFDPSIGFMRERLANGTWKSPFREFAWGGGFIEGSAWQHTFNVPHDPQGLAALMGGPAAVCRKLDAMLASPPTFEIGTYAHEIHEMTEMAMAGFGQYAHSNQPVHGFLFLYALLGEPEKTSHWVSQVAEKLYTPDSFPGDEDNGEMSAWYVWATLGLFPQCPGKPDYVHFTPLAKCTSFALPPLVGQPSA